MKNIFEIGPIQAKKGTKSTGFLHVGETTIMEVKIPIVIFHGVRDGPVLCISGGVHAYEYSSIEAVQRMLNLIDPTKLSGTVIVVPVVNTPSFESRGPQGGWSTAFQCPIDGINLNRIFPGNPEGTMGYQIAYVFMNQIVSKANYFIDCHGGDLNEELSPYVVAGASGDKEKDKQTMEILAASYDTDLVSISNTKGGSCVAAAQMGKPSIVAEAGGFGRIDENAVRWHVEGMFNAMKRLKMIEGTPNKARAQRIRKRFSLIVSRGGICYIPPLGTRVKKGDQVGVVKDMFGNVLEALKSPIDGVVCFRRNSFSVNTNDRVVGITPDEDLVPPERPYP
jgi:predicted deacylase